MSLSNSQEDDHIRGFGASAATAQVLCQFVTQSTFLLGLHPSQALIWPSGGRSSPAPTNGTLYPASLAAYHLLLHAHPKFEFRAEMRGLHPSQAVRCKLASEIGEEARLGAAGPNCPGANCEEGVLHSR